MVATGKAYPATVIGHDKTADIALIQSVARQIAAGHASSAVTIGYPPFIGIFTADGSQSSPLAQAQAQEQQNGFGDGFGGFGGFNGFGTPATTPACYTSNTDLTVPSARPGPPVLWSTGPLRQPGRRRRDDRRVGHHRGQRHTSHFTRRPDQHPGPVPARHHDLGGLDQPDGKAGHQQPAPDRRAAPVTSR